LELYLLGAAKIRNFMKKALIAMFLMVTTLGFSQDTRNVATSEVKSVKIFLAGAQVERLVKATVNSGTSQIAIEGLSSQVDQNSIYVTGTGEATILNVGYTLDYLKESKNPPELQKLRDSLDVLKELLEKETMMESVFNEEVNFMNSNKNTGGANTGVNADNLHKVADFYRQRMIEIKTKLIDIHAKQKKLNEKIAKLNSQIGEWDQKMNVPSGTILITVSAKQRTMLNLNVSYYTSGASWTPMYDLRAKDVNSPITLHYKATVTQTSGENWKDVQVALSTGNPSLGATKPELSVWYLNFMQPVYKQQEYLNKNSSMNARGERAYTPAIADVESMDKNVKVDQYQLSTEFEIQIPYTIMSDGKEVIMDIQTSSLPAMYSYYVTPKLDRDAFLMASITGWEQLNLLQGPANVYFENSYVGESFISPGATTDTLRLSLGRDKRIVVKREKVKDLCSTKVISGNTVKQFVYVLSVRNTKTETINITIEDQIPVAGHESIKVTVDETSDGKYNSENGMISWKKEIKPGVTEKIRLGFTVKYPGDKIINPL
jgi:uncharacterized protein (TIGR02231 family)